MQPLEPAKQLQLTRSLTLRGQCLLKSLPAPSLQEKAAQTPPPQQGQHEPRPSKEQLQPGLTQRIPRLRAVVESQAFKNILVDEMDMMFVRAATLIQANWRGYQLRKKLISQMTAAKAIQEAWRQFSTRRLLRYSKLGAKKSSRDEGNIPYHPPQQVRFQPLEDHIAVCPPVMINKETQFPSSDNLAPSKPQVAPGAPEPGMQTPRGPGSPELALLPPHTVDTRLPCPMRVGSKHQPCLMTKTVRSPCHIRLLDGDTVKSKHETYRVIKEGSSQSAASTRYGLSIPGPPKTQIQAHTEAEVVKASPHTGPTVTKTLPKTCPVVSIPKSPTPTSTEPKALPQACSPAIVTVMKNLPQTCTVRPTTTKSPAHIRPTSSITSATPQSHLAGTVARGPPPGSHLASSIKASPRPVVPTNRSPPQTGSGLGVTKTLLQTRPMTRNPPQMCPVVTSSKTFSQSSPVTKPSPQTRLAAMITKTPAQIRSVAALLKTFCLVPPVITNLKAPPQTQVAGVPDLSLHSRLNATKTKVTVSAKQTSRIAKAFSQSYLAEGKSRCAPQPHLDFGVPYPSGKTPLEAEKIKPGPPKLIIKETTSKTHTAMGTTRALLWTKIAEDRTKPPGQSHPGAEVIRVRSKVYTPVETPVALSPAQMAVPLTKALPNIQTPTRQARVQPHLAAHLSRAPMQPHTAAVNEVTMALPEGHLAMCPPSTVSQPQPATCLTKGPSQLHPSVEQTRVPSQARQATCPKKTSPQGCPPVKLSKAPSLAHLITCLTTDSSQAHIPIGLTKAHSQAQLVTETAKCLFEANIPTDLSSKTQSQPLLTSSKASIQFWQHFGSLSTGSQAKPEDRGVTQFQLHSPTQAKAATQSPRPVSVDPQSMLAPLLTSARQPTCNAESWGDSVPSRTPPPPPMPSQTMSCQDDMAVSQVASLCAEVLAALGSQEDLRALLVKALSQGEVRAAVNQALSREVLGSTVMKTLPQSMLGMALAKALSWGELGVTLSRALSRGELRTDLTKSMQSRLAEVLCKALSGEERAALSQALCQGELGAVFSQSLSQVAQRTGAIPPKATSKSAASRTSMASPIPVEVNCRGSLEVEWGTTLGSVKPRSSKVRPPWDSLAIGPRAGVLQGAGDGTTLEGLPCSPRSFRSIFWPRGMFTSTDQCPLIMGLDSVLSWEMERVFYSDLCPTPRSCKPLSDGKGPHLPSPFSPQSLPSPGQPLVANGAGPSTNQPSVSNNMVPSSHRPPVASRVSSRPWTSSREGSMVSGKLPGSVGGGQPPVQRLSSTCRGDICQCQNSVSSCLCHSSVAKSPNQLPKATEGKVRKTLSSCQKQASPSPREMMGKVSSSPPKATTLRQVEQVKEDGSPIQVSPNIRIQVLPSMPSPRQGRNPTHVSPMARSHSREPATRQPMSLLDELLGTLPQHPRYVLDKSFPRGPAADNSDSESSLPSSASISTMSVASVAASEIPKGFWNIGWNEAHQLESLMSRESGFRPLGLAHKTQRGQSCLRHVAPHVQPQSMELSSPLCSSTMSSRLALSIHWDSDSELDHSSLDSAESPYQDLVPPSLGKSVSLDAVIPTMDLQPIGTSQLDPTLSQPMLADRGSPDPDQPPGASTKSPLLSQPLEATQLSTYSPQPVFPSLTQPPAITGASPSLTHPSVVSGVSPVLAKPFSVTGESPSLTHPSVVSGVSPVLTKSFSVTGASPSLTQPSVVSGVSPVLTKPFSVTGASPSLTQPSVVSGVSPVLAKPFSVTGASPSLTQPSVVSGVSPVLAKPFSVTGASPSLTQPSVVSGVSPVLTKSLNVTGESPSLTHPSVVSGVSPVLTKPFSVTGESPSLTHPSVVSGVSPVLTKPFSVTGASPSLTQPSVVSGVSPVLAKPFSVTGASPSLTQPSVVSGVSPVLTKSLNVTGESPSLTHPSVVSGVSPVLTKPFSVTGESPSLTHPSVVSGVSPVLTKPFSVTGASPSLTQPSVVSGVSPVLTKPFSVTGASPSLTQPSVVSGVSPVLAKPFSVTGASPSLTQPSVVSGVSPVLTKSLNVTGESPSLTHPSVVSGVSPVLAKPFSVTGESPSLTHPSVVSGVSPVLTKPFSVTGESPSLTQPSVITGVPPSLIHASMATRVPPSLVQPSVVTGVLQSLNPSLMFSGGTPYQPHMYCEGSPSFAQPFIYYRGSSHFTQPSAIINRVASSQQSVSTEEVSSLAQPSVASRRSPSIAQPPATTPLAPNLAQTMGISPISPAPPTTVVGDSQSAQTAAAGVAVSSAHASGGHGLESMKTQLSETTGVPPGLWQPSLATWGLPVLGQPSLVTRVSPDLGQPSFPTGVSPHLDQSPLPIGVSSVLSQPSLATGVSSSVGQPFSDTRVSPHLDQSSLPPGVSPDLGQPSSPIGVSSVLSQPSLATGVSSSVGQPFSDTRVSPHLDQSSLPPGVSPDLGQPSSPIGVSSVLSQPSLATGVSPGIGQPSSDTRVSPHLDQSSLPTGVSPGLGQPSVATGMSPNFFQPSVSHEASSNPVQPPVVSIVSPSLAHASVDNRTNPSLDHPSVVGGMAPSLLQVPLSISAPPIPAPPFLTPGVYSRGSQSANILGSHSQLPPTVGYGVGHSMSQPALGSWIGSLKGLHTDNIGAMQSPPSIISSGSSHPRETSKVGQSPLGTQGALDDDPLMVTRSRPAPQGSLGLPEPPSVCRTPLTLLANSHPAFYHVSVGPEEVLGASVPCQTWFKGIATGTPQGPVAAGMFLSVCQGQASSSPTGDTPRRNVATSMSQSPCQVAGGTPPLASWGVEAGVPWSQQQASVVTGMGQGPCVPAVPNVLGGGPYEFFISQVGPGVPLPVTLDPQCHSVATVFPPNCQHAGMVSQDPGMGAVGGSSFVPGSIDSRVSLAMVSKPETESAALGLPRRSVIRGVGQSLAPGPVVGEVAQRIVGGMAQTLSPEATVDGTAQRLVDGVAQSVTPESTVGGVTPSLPLGSLTSGVAHSHPLVPVASGMAHRLPPGSVASGVVPSSTQVPDDSGKKLRLTPGSLASSTTSMSPGSMAGGASPNAPLGSMEGSVAPGSMLIGISPRPYPRGRTGEGSPSPVPCAGSLAQAHPWATEPGSAAQRLHQLPAALYRALQSSRDPGMASGVHDQQDLLKPAQIAETMSPVSQSRKDSPWKHDSPTEPVVPEHGPLVAETFSKGQRPLLEEEAPSQAGDLTSVPLWAPSSGRQSIANDTTPIATSPSASSRVPSSYHSADGVPKAQVRSVGDRIMTQALDPGVTEPLSPESLTHDEPQNHSLGTVASDVVSVSLQLDPRSTVTTEPVARMSNVSLPQSSGTAGMVSNVQLSVSLTQNIAPSQPKMEAVPSLSQSNYHEPLTQENPSRSSCCSIVSELLEGPMDRLKSSLYAQRRLSQALVGSRKSSIGAPSVTSIIPIIRAGDAVHDGRGRKLSTGVRRVSLGYESSPNGHRRPLHNENSHDTLPTVHHGTSLTPIVPQDPKSPVAGSDGSSPNLTVPHGQNPHHVTIPVAGSDEGSPNLTVPHGQNPHHVTIPVAGSDEGSPNPTVPQSLDPHYTTGPEAGYDRGSQTPTVSQGPVDIMASGQLWNSATPSVAVKPTDCSEALRSKWPPTRVPRPWDPAGNVAALDRKPSGELLVSMKVVKDMFVQAVVTIQACTRGYLVRRTIKVWHQWATIIQATWRGYCVRRNLAQLFRATTIIQAAWRGYCTRRDRACQVLLPTTWPAPDSGVRKTTSHPSFQGMERTGSNHRCFLSCQPEGCSVCRSLSPQLENRPSVVRLMGSAPRTCHVCGHTLSTRVVQGVGQGTSGRKGSRWASASQQTSLHPQQNQAATAIQSAWRGFKTRRQLSRQQSAAKMVQATWRGHYTRSCLTTDALLGSGGPWDRSRGASRRSSRSHSLHWPGV